MYSSQKKIIVSIATRIYSKPTNFPQGNPAQALRSILNFDDWNTRTAINRAQARRRKLSNNTNAEEITLTLIISISWQCVTGSPCVPRVSKNAHWHAPRKQAHQMNKWMMGNLPTALWIRPSRIQIHRQNHILFPMKRINYILNRTQCLCVCVCVCELFLIRDVLISTIKRLYFHFLWHVFGWSRPNLLGKFLAIYKVRTILSVWIGIWEAVIQNRSYFRNLFFFSRLFQQQKREANHFFPSAFSCRPPKREKKYEKKYWSERKKKEQILISAQFVVMIH